MSDLQTFIALLEKIDTEYEIKEADEGIMVWHDGCYASMAVAFDKEGNILDIDVFS